jgi:hypothetical protein
MSKLRNQKKLKGQAKQKRNSQTGFLVNIAYVETTFAWNNILLCLIVQLMRCNKDTSHETNEYQGPDHRRSLLIEFKGSTSRWTRSWTVLVPWIHFPETLSTIKSYRYTERCREWFTRTESEEMELKGTQQRRLGICRTEVEVLSGPYCPGLSKQA